MFFCFFVFFTPAGLSLSLSQGAQFNPTIMAVALPREVIEIEIPDTAGLDTVPYGDDTGEPLPGTGGSVPKRRSVRHENHPSLSNSHTHSHTHSQSVAFTRTGDFVMVRATPHIRSSGSITTLDSQSKRYFSHGMHTQTGTNSSIVSHVTIM